MGPRPTSRGGFIYAPWNGWVDKAHVRMWLSRPRNEGHGLRNEGDFMTMPWKVMMHAEELGLTKDQVEALRKRYCGSAQADDPDWQPDQDGT